MELHKELDLDRKIKSLEIDPHGNMLLYNGSKILALMYEKIVELERMIKEKEYNPL